MGKRTTLSAILALFILASLAAQENVKIKKNEFRTGVDMGFKEAWKSIREGDKYFEEGRGTFDLARDHYLFAHQYNPENAELNYKIGACYLFTDDKYEAINYLQKAYIRDENVSTDINLLLAQAHHLVLEFDEAAQHYKEHKARLKNEELVEYTQVLSKRLAECQNGKVLSREPVRVIIQNLGDNVNSRYDDYNPIFAKGDTALFFTSRRPSKRSKLNPRDNKHDEDIYRAGQSEEGFGEAVRLEKPYNTNNNDALVGISPGGNSLYIRRGHIQGGQIQVSSLHPEKGKWSRPRKLSGRLGSSEGETSLSIHPNGQELYFVSRNEDLTLGGKDILVSRLDEKGKWEKPRNMGGLINTEYDEEGVYITGNGQYLYFASQGHNSMGGFDIFRSERQPSGSWSAPENLGYPVNTPDDEVFFVTDKTGVFGYYSAIREGGVGAKDLYKVIFLGEQKDLITRLKDQLVAGPGGEKTGFITLPELPSLDTSLVVKGQILDTLEGRKPVIARLSFMDTEGRLRAVNAISNDSGKYLVRLPEPAVYGVEINAKGYLYFLDILDLMAETGDREILRDFYLERVEVGTKVVLENIYFETGKAVLRPESTDALDQVYKFMENNPGMKLEISGHTDNTGSLRINERLSRERAKAVVDYLVGRGIPEADLVYEGYADTQPVAPNDTPEGREQNRRVEFKVLSK